MSDSEERVPRGTEGGLWHGGEADFYMRSEDLSFEKLN